MDNTYALQIAIFEDSAADAALLVELIEKSGIRSEWETFESEETFLRSFRAGRYDLVFLDIYVAGAGGGSVAAGIHLAEQIRETDRYVTLAFITVSPAHTLESYRLGAIKYLEKSGKDWELMAGDVKETLEFALVKRKTRAVIALWMAGGKHMDVPLDDIQYFEQQGHVVAVHTYSSDVLLTSQSVKLNEIENRLPSPPFLRCHRSYIVNLSYALSVDREAHAYIMKSGDIVYIRRGGLRKYDEALKLCALENTGKDGL